MTPQVTLPISDRVPPVIAAGTSPDGGIEWQLATDHDTALPNIGMMSNGPVVDAHDLRIVDP